MLRGAGLTSLSNQYMASEGQRNLRAFEKYIRYAKKLEGVAKWYIFLWVIFWADIELM